MTSPVTQQTAAPADDPTDTDTDTDGTQTADTTIDPSDRHDTDRTHLEVVGWFDPFLAQHGYDPRLMDYLAKANEASK